jgi:hypothetical protein
VFKDVVGRLFPITHVAYLPTSSAPLQSRRDP